MESWRPFDESIFEMEVSGMGPGSKLGGFSYLREYKRIPTKRDRFYTDIQFDVIDFSITIIRKQHTVCFL